MACDPDHLNHNPVGKSLVFKPRCTKPKECVVESEELQYGDIWFVEDCAGQHGYGQIRQDAERFVSGNRGYDGYDGSGFNECVDDGWAKPAVKIRIPLPVIASLLKLCDY